MSRIATPPQPQIIITGYTGDQFLELLKEAVRQVQVEQTPPNPDDALPELLTAAEAAEVLKYKSAASLRQYHNQKSGLRPQRRNRKTFYEKHEVLRLRKILFGK